MRWGLRWEGDKDKVEERERRKKRGKKVKNTRKEKR
jgi:hypothetical protein